MTPEMEVASASRRAPWFDLRQMDILVLERALVAESNGTMIAPLARVVRTAVEKWGYPGSAGAAESILLRSGRYEIRPDGEGGERWIRPR